MAWSSCGALDSVTDPMTNVTEYSYDSAGRLTELHLPGTNRGLHIT
jgi:YD repeat-containing protein